MPKLPGSGADLPEVNRTKLIPILIDDQMFMKTEQEALEIADQILMLVISRKKT